jgi:hypothetical protein
VFSGGLALYDAEGVLIGGLGVSGPIEDLWSDGTGTLLEVGNRPPLFWMIPKLQSRNSSGSAEVLSEAHQVLLAHLASMPE